VQELFPRTVVVDGGQIVADGLTMEMIEAGIVFAWNKRWLWIAMGAWRLTTGAMRTS
jgi:hypothetical protein